jgi:DNA-binding transcriptional MerR regulator
MDCNAHLMAANELINIREMSKRSSVPAATLRYYEKLGLITSERETSGGHRRYSEATLHRITYITLAQLVGFSLEEIAEQRLSSSNGPRKPLASLAIFSKALSKLRTSVSIPATLRVIFGATVAKKSNRLNVLPSTVARGAENAAARRFRTGIGRQ